MALTEEQIEHLADKYLVGLYQQMEKDVIQDVARRVRKTDRLTETAEIMARNMHEQGFSTSQISRGSRLHHDGGREYARI